MNFDDDDDFKSHPPVGATVNFSCAACGRSNEIYVDAQAGESQSISEDCEVCCFQNLVHASWMDDTGEWDIWAEAEEQ